MKIMNPDRPFVIAGPCSAENEEQVIATAIGLKEIGIQVFRAGLWKPRTKPGSFEGVGNAGLQWLSRVKRETGLLTCVEVANSSHVKASLKAGIDMIWIGARTSANPFAVQEIADTLKGCDIPILIKNPVNPDVDLWMGAIERFQNSGISCIYAVHRGFSTYERGLYRNIPQWYIPIELKRRLPDVPMLCDPSHIAGRRDLILQIAQQSMDLGFDGLMIESHIDPGSALSDKEQQVTPSELKTILSSIIIRDYEGIPELLKELRREIDEIDDRLLTLISRRMQVAREIGRCKKSNKIPILQPTRYERLVTHKVSCAESLQLDPDFIKRILEAIHEESVRQQLTIINSNEEV
jgi:chorismate mutase